MSSIYEVLRRPIVTEKSNYMVTKLHQYVFEVASDANRTLVKDAVEKIFNVKVVRVNVNSQYKKALITLIPEDRIPIFEGVE